MAHQLPISYDMHQSKRLDDTFRIPHGRAATLAAAYVLAIACGGDDKTSLTKTAAAASQRSVVSTGDVVIKPPVAPYTVAPVASPGTITGAIVIKGALSPLPPAATGRDSTICGPDIPDESVRLQGGGLSGVVVWLEGTRSGKPLGLERRIELESSKCRLRPRVQAAVVGSAVNILGHDEFRERLNFSAGGETAPRAAVLLGGGEQVIPTELPFRAPGMVTIQDAEHAWPRAWIAVFDHPYFAVSGVGGTFTIDGVPPGKYTLHAWHERAAASAQEVDVGANGQLKVAVELTPR